MESILWSLTSPKVSTIGDRNQGGDSECLAALVHSVSVISAGCTIVELTLTKSSTVKLTHLLLRLVSVLNERREIRSMVIRIPRFIDTAEGRQERSGIGSHMSAILTQFGQGGLTGQLDVLREQRDYGVLVLLD